MSAQNLCGADTVTTELSRDISSAVTPISLNSDISLRDEKLPYIQAIATRYQGGYHDLLLHKFFTSSHLAYFAMLDVETLRNIHEDVDMIRALGDRAPAFVSMCITGRNELVAVGGVRPPSAAEARTISRKESQRRAARERDNYECVITGRETCVQCAHIMPFHINSSTANIAKLHSSFDVATKLFGSAFSKRLYDLLVGVGESDESWNMLVLNSCLHDLFDRGYCGFRPLKITKTTTGGDKDTAVYTVHFSVHWFSKVRAGNPKPDDEWRPRSITLEDLANLTVDRAAPRVKRTDRDIVSGVLVREGDEFTIHHHKQSDAENMFDMLHLRWAAAMLWYMSGAAGLVADDDEDDDQGKPDDDIWSYKTRKWQRLEGLLKEEMAPFSGP